MRAGRTTISHQPPTYSGTFAELLADGNGDGIFESMLGDTVVPGSSVRALVDEAPGATLRLVSDQGTQEVAVDSASFTHDFTLPADAKYVRAEVFYEDLQEQRSEQQQICDDLEPLIAFFTSDPMTYCQSRLAVVALTSPVYFAQPEVDRSTTLLYDGDGSGRVGQTATFSATLTGTEGPVAGAPVTFAYRGETFEALTDQAGRASATIKVVGPPGSYEVVSTFAGDPAHLPSSDRDAFIVTTGRP